MIKSCRITLIALLILIFLKINLCYSQGVNKDISLEKTSEKVVSYNFGSKISKGQSMLIPAGYINKSILYYYENFNDTSIKFYLLNEDDYSFEQLYKSYNLKGKYLYSFIGNDAFLFYRKINFDSMDDDGYSQLIIKSSTYEIIVDSIFNSDKKIHASFSSDGKYLLANSLNTLSDYYNPKQDDRIMVYALDSIRKGITSKEYINCTHCVKSFLLNDKLFFTKSNQLDDFSDGFEYTDIYVSSWKNLKNADKVAGFTDILVVSPDGKYILGKRNFDMPNNPCVIIDVENKRYQILLGRDYSKMPAFYSFKEKKFAFDFGGRIVYIEFPKVYPFDALSKDNSHILGIHDENFFKKFHHEPFNK
jgi:hypothetical protein